LLSNQYSTDLQKLPFHLTKKSWITPFAQHKILTLIVCILAIFFLFQYRFSRIQPNENPSLKVTTWDAFGYYLYLPGIFIYQDVKDLQWLPEIENKYQLTGGDLYQANRYKNGNFVFKYLGGVAILEAPFFAIAHLYAKLSPYPADGFSAPYQYALAIGALFYFSYAIFLLRHLLLLYFSDLATAITIILLVLATNLPQYIAVESAMSHAYIFPLYALIIWLTIRWHKSPTPYSAFLIGLTIGLATISRPTELIMVFIPIFWNTQNKIVAKEKWQNVKKHLNQLYLALAGGFIGIAPQLIYWQIVTGFLIYDVGSKWYFLNPFFDVLIGWPQGWFIYTPITILFIFGLFFIKKFPFSKSFTIFILVNIWIIISWADWKYGASYSTRALVQSYPVMAFPFAALISQILKTKWKYALIPIGFYLIFVNLFQLKQYQNGILHHRDMNRKYYAAIYLDSNPTPLDMSLLYNPEKLKNPKEYQRISLYKSSETIDLFANNGNPIILDKTNFLIDSQNFKKENWLYFQMDMSSHFGFWDSWIVCKISGDSLLKEVRYRIGNPLTIHDSINRYEFFVKIPETKIESLEYQLSIETDSYFTGKLRSLEVQFYR